MVDGNNKTKDKVHFMLIKSIVQQISDEYMKDSNKTNGMMTFSLVPYKNGSMAMSGNMNMNMTMGMGMK